ncbi:hypothetical protein JHK82_033970 [Glycine max]|uniref:Uncharacterized protein n=1 Tax=Glycine max TaxID=3847 RepID=K7LV48_SOYBN|nr:hypothetical protein JHK85_034679 [Glycine max]KAG5119550.1 hypothetical protein JHK82_033970 [Glycine max]KAG5140540.1 hypothetical protein JHK84_034308 [Glycine max]KAH1143344.1 hypothetical protein GYH30_033860 [Glycine max]KRH26153.1 hypothetical protein GLYMA_12G155500v4 [Glycine max]
MIILQTNFPTSDILGRQESRILRPWFASEKSPSSSSQGSSPFCHHSKTKSNSIINCGRKPEKLHGVNWKRGDDRFNETVCPPYSTCSPSKKLGDGAPFL